MTEDTSEEDDNRAQDFPCPLMPVVCLDETQEHNRTHPIPSLEFNRAYIVFGEPALEPNEYSLDGGTRHYMLYDLRTGKMIPGMVHGDRFRRVTHDDNFF